MSKMYHCFWTEPVGNASKYEATDNFDRVESLAAAHARYPEGWPYIRDLRVIYGELLEFEPVEVVTKWKIKE